MFLARRLHLASPLVLLLFLPLDLALAVDREQIVSLSPVVRTRIDLSLQIAAQRLEELESCRALFEPFGRDGRDLLRSARIVPAEHTPHAWACEREGVTLVTRVYGDTIGVCGRQLGRLPVHETAARLLHETLHHAGMGERPHDPNGLFPEQITRRVKRACRL